jgi:hypothetical protein
VGARCRGKSWRKHVTYIKTIRCNDALSFLDGNLEVEVEATESADRPEGNGIIHICYWRRKLKNKKFDRKQNDMPDDAAGCPSKDALGFILGDL